MSYTFPINPMTVMPRRKKKVEKKPEPAPVPEPKKKTSTKNGTMKKQADEPGRD